MNYSTLISSVCVSLALSTAASAQWSSSGGGINIGVGGVYGSGSRTVSGPNGRIYKDSYSNNETSFRVGLGGYSNNTNGYGYGYGLGAAPIAWSPYYNGGYGMGGGMYGGGCYGPVVMPYYGGGCAPVVVPYSPFTRTYATPCYAPQVIAPAAYCPQMPICW